MIAYHRQHRKICMKNRKLKIKIRKVAKSLYVCITNHVKKKKTLLMNIFRYTGKNNAKMMKIYGKRKKKTKKNIYRERKMRVGM